ncbi:hypothetical protein [Vibrio sp.]|uniref:hypothetical protein n=1 Tax=Vibrio sp. TaxID=678 RepID=UPI00311F6003
MYQTFLIQSKNWITWPGVAEIDNNRVTSLTKNNDFVCDIAGLFSRRGTDSVLAMAGGVSSTTLISYIEPSMSSKH